MDEVYYNEIGITRTKLNERFLSGLSVDNVLEVGCNAGVQLPILNKMGLKAAKAYGADHIVELCGDCPLIDPTIIDEMILNW
ncbi:MAG: hypothetical protein WBC40_03675 [Halobacteriota archaeon]